MVYHPCANLIKSYIQQRHSLLPPLPIPLYVYTYPISVITLLPRSASCRAIVMLICALIPLARHIAMIRIITFLTFIIVLSYTPLVRTACFFKFVRHKRKREPTRSLFRGRLSRALYIRQQRYTFFH